MARRIERTSSFLHYCSLKDHVTVEEILNDKDSTVDINVLSEKGKSALHLAIKNDDYQLAKLLIEKGMNLEIKDKETGLTPLQYSCSLNKSNLVSLLISKQANPRIVDENGWTALHWAAYGDSAKSIYNLIMSDKMLVDMKDKDENYAIHIAIENKRLSAFKQIIQSVNARFQFNREGLLPIHLVALLGYVDMLAELIDQKVNVDELSKNQRTALHFACDSGHFKIVEMLIKFGAKRNIMDNNGKTPFLIAQEKNRQDIALLLKNNAEKNQVHELIKLGNKKKLKKFLGKKKIKQEISKMINETDFEGNKALHLAIHKSNKDMVAILLTKGADPNMPDKTGLPPLFTAICEAKNEIIDLLLSKKVDALETDKQGNTALHHAINCNQFEVAKRLLGKLSLDLNQKNNQGLTALHLCAQSENSEIVEILLNSGANPNIKNSMNKTPLHIAIEQKKRNIITAFLAPRKHEILDIEACDDKGRTYLMYAIQSHNLAILEMLLEKKANVKTRDSNGDSAVHYAISEDQPEILKKLLDTKDVDLGKSGSGIPVLHLCIQCNNTIDCAQILYDNGIDFNIKDDKGRYPVHYAAEFESVDFLIWIAKCNSDLELQDRQGNTALHISARKGRAEEVSFLVSKKVDLNRQNSEKQTPLHLACANGRASCAEILVENKADLTIKDSHLKTPFMTAVSSGFNEIAEMLFQAGSQSPLLNAVLSQNIPEVESLCDQGYTLNLRDKNGDTHLHYAIRTSNENLVQKLLEHDADPNIPNNQMNFPLYEAVMLGNAAMCKSLMIAGADVMAKKDGEFLHVLAKKNKSTCYSVLKTEFKRLSAIQKLFENEKKYAQIMKSLIDFIIAPISKQQILKPNEMEVIFRGVGDILELSAVLVKDLEEHLKKWNSTKGISNIIWEFAPNLRQYIPYHLHFEESQKMIAKCAKNSVFASFMRSIAEDPRMNRMTLTNLLLEPVKHVGMYPVLMEEVAKTTPKTHPDFAQSQRAFRFVKKITEEIKDSKRAQEDAVKIQNIQGMLSHGTFDLTAKPLRRFLMEGTLSVLNINELGPSVAIDYLLSFIKFKDYPNSPPKNENFLRNHYCLSYIHGVFQLSSDPIQLKASSLSSLQPQNLVSQSDMEMVTERTTKRMVAKLYSKKLHKTRSAIANSTENPIGIPNPLFSPKYLFLFNDYLLVCKPTKESSFEVQYEIPMISVFAEAYPEKAFGNNPPYAIKIISSVGSFIIGSNSQETTDIWLQAFRSATLKSILENFQLEKIRLAESMGLSPDEVMVIDLPENNPQNSQENSPLIFHENIDTFTDEDIDLRSSLSNEFEDIESINQQMNSLGKNPTPLWSSTCFFASFDKHLKFPKMFKKTFIALDFSHQLLQSNITHWIEKRIKQKIDLSLIRILTVQLAQKPSQFLFEF